MPFAAAHKNRPNHRHGSRVGHFRYPLFGLDRFAASLLSRPLRNLSSFVFQTLSACFRCVNSCFAAATSSGLTQRLPCFL